MDISDDPFARPDRPIPTALTPAEKTPEQRLADAPSFRVRYHPLDRALAAKDSDVCAALVATHDLFNGARVRFAGGGAKTAPEDRDDDVGGVNELLIQDRLRAFAIPGGRMVDPGRRDDDGSRGRSSAQPLA